MDKAFGFPRTMATSLFLSAALIAPASVFAVEAVSKDTARPVSIQQDNAIKEKEAAQALTLRLEGLKTLQASFEQHTIDEGGRRLQESHGEMLIKRPNLFRWNVIDPFPQEVVSDGHRVSYFDKELDQVTIQDVDMRTSTTPALLLSGDTAKVLQSFSVRLSSAGANQMFTLMPRGNDGSFQELSLRFDNGTLNDMTLLDTLGSRTRITFTGVKVNEKIRDKQFELYIPPGVDVIDQTSVKPRPVKPAS